MLNGNNNQVERQRIHLKSLFLQLLIDNLRALQAENFRSCYPEAIVVETLDF